MMRRGTSGIHGMRELKSRLFDLALGDLGKQSYASPALQFQKTTPQFTILTASHQTQSMLCLHSLFTNEKFIQHTSNHILHTGHSTL